MSAASSVKMFKTLYEKVAMRRMTGTRMRNVSFITRCIMGITLSSFPCPMKLLTRVEMVEPKATSVIKVKAETLRMMLVAAKSCCPRCSMARKKINHVPSDRKFCIIIHTLKSNTFFRMPKRKRGMALRAYFAQSMRREV